MLTISKISKILDSPLIDGEGKEENEINDFETMYRFVKSKKTAYISPNKITWWKQLSRDKNAPDGNDFINKDIKDIGLIITENYIPDLTFKIPQIIVKDSVNALITLAKIIRDDFKNPIVAITGSMGKSSTRILLSTMLKEHTALQNRGNNNIRSAIYANMLKLIQKQEYAVIETSLNALNNRGNTTLDLKPDIAIITGLGAAHYSTFENIQQIAELKSRVFDGLSKNGTAIFNKDTLFTDYLYSRAKENTDNVLTYSLIDPKATLYVENYIIKKGYTEISAIYNQDKRITYNLYTISEGMILNSLAVILTLLTLKVPIRNEYFKDFKPFIHVLAMKEIQTPTHTVTLLDDTHNASLPAMINAIQAFNSQAEFFKGNRIIALGKINDLGHKSKEIHEELIEVLENSKADYILCLDEDFRSVVAKIKNKNITWYPNINLMMQDLLYLCNVDAFTLLKSSSGGTDFPKIAKELPVLLEQFVHPSTKEHLFDYAATKGRSYIKVDNRSLNIIAQYNMENSQSIDGLGALINYIYAIQTNVNNQYVSMGGWVTNNDTYFKGKKIFVYDLIKDMTNAPHPSATYELSKYLFENNTQRDAYKKQLIDELSLSNSIAVNLTGRFMPKQRQSYTVMDLYEIFKKYHFDLFRYSNSFIIGNKYKSGFIFGENETTIFTSYKNIKDIEKE